jgi:hypothetical protein
MSQQKPQQRGKMIVNKSLEVNNFPTFKEKSWSSRIVEGHFLNGQVKAEQCTQCTSCCNLVTFGCGDSNSLLYGCTGHKCKHILIRVKFSPDSPNENTIRSV